MLWREQGRFVALSVTCAFLVTVLTLAITSLIQRVVDDAIVADDMGALPRLVGLMVALSTVRFAINVVRRTSTSIVGIRVEARMRALMYDAYLTYPRRFYDRHATGDRKSVV